MNIHGNTILITGATSGIGKELLRQFYEAGNNIIATSGNAQNLATLNQQFQAITTLLCDLADPIAVQSLISTCLSQHPDINMLINNAGIQENYNWREEKEGIIKIEREIRINLTSPLQITYGLLPLLLSKQEAAIINVSSGLALAPKKSAPIYCATKAAVHTATKALRYQLENSPVKVFEILPALVDTPMTQGRGKGKITPQQLADEFFVHFKKDKWESYIGKTKILRHLLRWLPHLAERILKNA